MGTISTKIIPIIDKVPIYSLESNINIGSNDVVYELSNILHIENPTIFLSPDDAIKLLSFEFLNEIVWRLLLFKRGDNFNPDAKIEIGRQIIKLINLRLMI